MFLAKPLSFQFVANEHKNGGNNSEPKGGVIEPDGPSVVSKDEDDSKVRRDTDHYSTREIVLPKVDDPWHFPSAFVVEDSRPWPK